MSVYDRFVLRPQILGVDDDQDNTAVLSAEGMFGITPTLVRKILNLGCRISTAMNQMEVRLEWNWRSLPWEY